MKSTFHYKVVAVKLRNGKGASVPARWATINWSLLAYVDLNPVRAHLVGRAGHYPQSSATAHLAGRDPAGLLDLEMWREVPTAMHWTGALDKDKGTVTLTISRRIRLPRSSPVTATSVCQDAI